MCGIAGLLAANSDARQWEPSLSAALQKLAYRGPDASGSFFSGPFACAHARLSIIDTDPAANQPFTDESGRYVLVFNGEIFNFSELKEELLAPLHIAFRSRGDTEVLLHLLIHFGPAVLSRLRGFFAFAFYDTQQGELMLARDRFGQKPLWYSTQQEFVAFASEFKALNCFPLRKDPDRVSYEMFFRLSYLPAPYTAFTNIYKLEPGHYLLFRNGKELCKKNWYPFRLPDTLSGMNYSEAVEAVRNTVTESVKYRLIADVPTGSFLSGGLDSAVVTAVAAAQRSNFSSYALSFPDMPYMDESAAAAETAAFIGSNHHTIAIRQAQMEHALQDVLEYTDDLFADSSAIAVHVLCSEVSRHLKVALSGDGGDEIFGGYRKHKALLLGQRTRMLRPGFTLFSSLMPETAGARTSGNADRLRKLLKFSRMAAHKLPEQYAYTLEWFHHEFTHKLLSAKDTHALTDARIASYLPQEGTYLSRILLADILSVLQGDMLSKVDLFSMRNGIEVRNPLLDHRLVELAFQLPDSYRIGEGSQKRILKDAFRHMLPPNQFSRPKKGFEVPLQLWLRGSFNRQMKEEWLNRKTIEQQGVLNYSYIQELYAALEKGNADAHFALWNAIVFTKWFTLYA